MKYIDGIYELTYGTNYPDYIPLGAPTDHCRIACDDNYIYIISAAYNDNIICNFDRRDWGFTIYPDGVNITRFDTINIGCATEGRYDIRFNRKDVVRILPAWYHEGDKIAENAYPFFECTTHRLCSNHISRTMIIHRLKKSGRIVFIDTATGIKFYKEGSKIMAKLAASANIEVPVVTISDTEVIVNNNWKINSAKIITENDWRFKFDLPLAIKDSLPYLEGTRIFEEE